MNAAISDVHIIFGICVAIGIISVWLPPDIDADYVTTYIAVNAVFDEIFKNPVGGEASVCMNWSIP